jgi:hypothetical protein
MSGEINFVEIFGENPVTKTLDALDVGEGKTKEELETEITDENLEKLVAEDLVEKTDPENEDEEPTYTLNESTLNLIKFLKQAE